MWFKMFATAVLSFQPGEEVKEREREREKKEMKRERRETHMPPLKKSSQKLHTAISFTCQDLDTHLYSFVKEAEIYSPYSKGSR